MAFLTSSAETPPSQAVNRVWRWRCVGTALLPLLSMLALALPVAAQPLRVMSFNIWGGGLNEGESIAATAAALRAADADVIGLQETRGEADVCSGNDCSPRGEAVSAALARALGYYHYEQSRANDALWANAILSRYPITASSPEALGVRIDVAGHSVVLFNIHATDYPYQPYQLLRIPYDKAPFLETAEEAVAAAREARAGALALLRQELAFARDAALVIVTGDFNEPSGRDWTARAAAAGRHPLPVPWPFTASLESLGFLDGYRTARPDEMSAPGFTWSPRAAHDNPMDHADRIDYVFLRGDTVRIRAAEVMGEATEHADIVVSPWPSDHRAVIIDLEF